MEQVVHLPPPPPPPMPVGRIPLPILATIRRKDLKSFLSVSQGFGSINMLRHRDGNSCLHIAAECDAFEIAKYLLTLPDLEIDSVSKSGTPLQLAIASGSVEVVFLLLEHRANFQVLDNKNQTVLHLAVINEELDLLRLFVGRKQLDLDARMINGMTPLLLAASKNNRDALQLLLDAGANPSACNDKGDNSLHYLCKSRSPFARALVAQLIAANVDINCCNSDGVSPLNLALENENLDIAVLLIEHGALPIQAGNNGRSALHLACQKGSVEAVSAMLKILVPCGSVFIDDQDAQGCTPLFLASNSGAGAVVAQLVALGASVHTRNVSGETPLHVACRRGSLAVAECLLSAGAEAEVHCRDGFTPLHRAVSNGAVELVTYLVQHGAHPDTCTRNGDSPLLLACCCGNLPLVKLFVSSGVNPNLIANDGRTPLRVAVKKKLPEIVGVLLEAGAEPDNAPDLVFDAVKSNLSPAVLQALLAKCDVDVANKNGYTALMVAVGCSNFMGIDALLALGASCRVQALDGDTPLHLACRRKELSVVQRLVSAGAPINVYNKKSKSPVFEAVEQNSLEITAFLFQSGADPTIDETKSMVALLQRRELSPQDYELLLRLDDSVARKTASATLVRGLPICRYNGPSDETCLVCMDVLEEKSDVIILPKCKHTFHAPCISKWLSGSSTKCPIDGQNVVLCDEGENAGPSASASASGGDGGGDGARAGAKEVVSPVPPQKNNRLVRAHHYQHNNNNNNNNNNANGGHGVRGGGGGGGAGAGVAVAGGGGGAGGGARARVLFRHQQPNASNNNEVGSRLPPPRFRAKESPL